MSKLFSRFLKDESGATAIEYGLIAALISVAIITGATTLGSTLNSTFQNISTKMNAAAIANK
ncbi:Flp family type IVb pilin [Rhizobium sp. BR 314]|uniref:Flp family type IVb pilin n=1 Tax=Rhizobium sp. BR 314 TaxID=3040013 RepID=UPI0039BF9D90